MYDKNLAFSSENINKDRKFTYTFIFLLFSVVVLVLVLGIFKEEYLSLFKYFGLAVVSFLAGRFSHKNNNK